jgi:magnesium-transporting ATPase (P-type)
MQDFLSYSITDILKVLRVRPRGLIFRSGHFFLQKTIELRAQVVRNSRKEEVAAPELVPGDKVPADARLIEARGLEVNEAALTGESMTVGKDVQIILPERTPLAERAYKNFFCDKLFIALACIIYV